MRVKWFPLKIRMKAINLILEIQLKVVSFACWTKKPKWLEVKMRRQLLCLIKIVYSYLQWKSYLFMLTDTKMYYAQFQQHPDDEDDSEDKPLHLKDNDQPIESTNEPCFGEDWFHGKLEVGRTQAAELLRKYSNSVDGTFLVRESDTFIGDYSLSFLHHGQVNHCRIRSKFINGVTKYYLMDTVTFDSMYSLINYYQSHPLQNQEISIKLGKPVPPTNNHEQEDWFHGNLNRQEAEDILNYYDKIGSFLVRPSENEENCFSITFRAKNCIKHCRVRQEGRLFVIGNDKYETMKTLINWYQKKPLYKDVMLKYPINRRDSKLLQKMNVVRGENCVESSYLDPNNYESSLRVRALFNYRGQKSDELSFPKHAVINNVIKHDSGWWKGDYGGHKNGWFPSNYVQEIDFLEGDSSSSSDNEEKGSIDLLECSVVNSGGSISGKQWVFKITSPTQLEPIEIAASCEEEMNNWIKQIRETAQSANHKVKDKIAIFCKEKKLSIKLDNFFFFRFVKGKKRRRRKELLRNFPT